MLVAVCELERMTVEQEEGVVESKIPKVTKLRNSLPPINSTLNLTNMRDVYMLEMWIITPSLHCGLKLALLSDQR